MTLNPSAVAFKQLPWSQLPVEQIAPGIERQMINVERLMICRLRFSPHVITAVHTHPHEQMTIVERGRVRFSVEGEDRIASAGDVLLFPSGIQHGATMLDEEVVLIDVFSPIRDEFLPGAKAGSPAPGR